MNACAVSIFSKLGTVQESQFFFNLLFMTNYLVYTVKANFEFPGLLFLILK